LINIIRSFGVEVNMNQTKLINVKNNGGQCKMPSIPVNSLELNSHAVTTTAAGLRSLVPGLNSL